MENCLQLLQSSVVCSGKQDCRFLQLRDTVPRQLETIKPIDAASRRTPVAEQTVRRMRTNFGMSLLVQ